MKISCTLLLFICIYLPGRAQWVNQSSPFTNKVHEKIFFITPQTGFITGWNGLILKTNDGGNSWQNIFSSTFYNFRDIIFRDTLEGYAAGEYQTIVRSADGGSSWTTIQQKQAYYLNSLAYHDSLIVAAGDSGIMITSTDSGQNWTTVPLPSIADIHDVWIMEDGKIILAGNDGTILSRSHADSAWKIIASGTTYVLRNIFFADSNTGYIVGGQFITGSAGIVLKSTDAGNSWQTLAFPISLPQFNAVHFTSPDTGYVVGAKGTIMKTTNGGLSWVFQPTATLNLLNGIYFTSSQTGFVVGDGSKILRTANGGGTSIMEMQTDPFMVKVYPNPTSGFIYLDRPADQLDILDISGKLLYSGNEKPIYSIDLSALNLAKGFYFLRIACEGGYVITKLRLQ